MDKKEIKYENGCKLEFKGLDVQDVEQSSGKSFTSPWIWVDPIDIELFENHTELEKQYLKYLEEHGEPQISLSEWCLRNGKYVKSNNINADVEGVTFTLSNIPLSTPMNYKGDISEYGEDNK